MEQRSRDKLARTQRAHGQEPEDATFQPTANSYGPVFRLNYLFEKYCSSGKRECLVVVDAGKFVVCALDMTPKVEKAALHAVLDWLKPPWSHYHPEDRQDRKLDDLRDRLRRAAQHCLDTLNGRATLTEPEFVPGPADIMILTVLAKHNGAQKIMQIVQEADRLNREAIQAHKRHEVVALNETTVKERIPLLQEALLVARPLGKNGQPTQRKGIGVTEAGRRLLAGRAP
jgi:hypothetical protein